MVEDEFGRDPAIRYKETTLLLFPLTMISKRIEDGELVNVMAIYEGLEEHVQDSLPRTTPAPELKRYPVERVRLSLTLKGAAA